jgi:hypothetical protein
MTQPIAPDEQVNACAARYFRPMPDNSLYASFAGLVEGVVTDKAMTDEQRIAEIRTGLAALNLMIAEKRAVLVIPHGPVRPPYGSPLRATARERVDKVAPAPVACSDKCAARPEEWPCLDSCPAQRAARGES